MRDTRSEYAARMHRVLEHIDRHLDQPLELDTLAAVANFSAFHFHRLFSAWMGETLGEYLRRRRLEVAAMRLVTQPSTQVLPVALAVGFGSAEAFSRAFKTRFGTSPTAWRARERAQRNADQANSNLNQEVIDGDGYRKASRISTSEALMKVTLIDRKPTTVAYLRQIGPYGAPIGAFWQDTVAPWMMTNGLFGRPRYGISHDDPGITAPEKCRYDACVEVDADFSGTGPFHITVIPGGKYASGQFKGRTADFVDAWAALLRDWLPGSGMQLDARPMFEYYGLDSTFDPKTGVLGCELCIPVTAL